MARKLEKTRYSVAGVVHYQDNLMKLSSLNPEWDNVSTDEKELVKVFKYNFKNKPLEIDDDPDTPSQLRIRIDGLKVGELNLNDSIELKEILKGEVKYTSAFVRGGPYKEISTSGEVEEIDDRIRCSISVGYVSEK